MIDRDDLFLSIIRELLIRTIYCFANNIDELIGLFLRHLTMIVSKTEF